MRFISWRHSPVLISLRPCENFSDYACTQDIFRQFCSRAVISRHSRFSPEIECGKSIYFSIKIASYRLTRKFSSIHVALVKSFTSRPRSMHASYSHSKLLLGVFLSVPLVNPLNLFSENLDDLSTGLDWTSLKSDPNDDNTDLFNEDSEISLTDPILISGCDTQQQSLLDDEQSLFSRDNTACPSTQPPSQPLLPLSPETLQLFQDPSSLERLLLDSEPTKPNIQPKYPGRLTPLEEWERESSFQDFHDLSDMNGESWKTFQGDTGPCDRFKRGGLTFAVCCDGPADIVEGYQPENWVQYQRVNECDPLDGMLLC